MDKQPIFRELDKATRPEYESIVDRHIKAYQETATEKSFISEERLRAIGNEVLQFAITGYSDGGSL